MHIQKHKDNRHLLRKESNTSDNFIVSSYNLLLMNLAPKHSKSNLLRSIATVYNSQDMEAT